MAFDTGARRRWREGEIMLSRTDCAEGPSLVPADGGPVASDTFIYFAAYVKDTRNGRKSHNYIKTMQRTVCFGSI